MSTFTVRLSDLQATMLDTISRLEGTAKADLVREAVGYLISQRIADPEFQAKVNVEAERLLQLQRKEG